MTRRRRWLIVLVVTWAVLLLGLAFVVDEPPTVSQQQSVVGARSTVDRSMAEVLRIVGDRAAVTVGGYRRVRLCNPAVNRSGEQYRRVADLYGRPEDVAGLLDRLAAALPAGYHAQRVSPLFGPATAAPDLAARPGSFVTLTARPVGSDPGHVQVTADTGCRPFTGHPGAEFVPAPGGTERKPVSMIFDALRVRPARWQRDNLTCPDGGAVRTVTGVSGPVPDPGLLGLPDRLHGTGPAAGTLLSATGTRYAVRLPGGSLVASFGHGRLTVQSTADCGQ